jgi:hydroxymethylglutaryl-CoA reductase
MKLHLMNILNHLEATEKEVKLTVAYFKNKIVSFTAVREFLKKARDEAAGLVYNRK